jgi:hypothetical protein
MMDEGESPDFSLSETVAKTAGELREDLALWEAMKEYLQHIPKARIAEMPNASRQAMESALKRHPETFKVTKDRRDKYISLKGQAQLRSVIDAPATNGKRK